MDKYKTRIIVRTSHSAIYYSTSDIKSVRDTFEHGRTIYADNNAGELVLLNSSVIPIIELRDLCKQETLCKQDS